MMAIMPKREGLPDFFSEPQIRHLPQVLEEIHRGQLLFPRFQRPLVWPKDMRLALLESVLQGIPIGTILVWRTRSIDVAAKDRLGPFLLPRPDPDLPIRQYLLDGEQRLSTLYFALFEPQPASQDDEEGPDDFRVYVDLNTGRLLTRSELPEPQRHHLPLVDVLQGARLTRFQRRLVGRAPSKPVDELTEISDEVADAFRQYKLPTVPIVSENLGLVTRSFERINSQHMTMSEVHMVNALSWTPKFDLLERIDQMRKGPLAEVNWGEVDDQIILRVCKVAAGLLVYEEDADALNRELRQSSWLLDEVTQLLVETARFLADECGIRAPGLAPYNAQIILLAGAFREVHEPSTEARHRLRDWLWLTTYAETFQRQMSDSRFGQLLEDVRSLARGERARPLGGNPPSRRELTRFDFRHARSRALALFMAKHRPRDPVTGRIFADGYELLAQYGARAVPQLVASSSPGARVVVRPGRLVELREALRREDASREFLQSHFVNPSAHEALMRRDDEAFAEIRWAELERREESRFNQIVQHLYYDRTIKRLRPAPPRRTPLPASPAPSAAAA